MPVFKRRQGIGNKRESPFPKSPNGRTGKQKGEVGLIEGERQCWETKERVSYTHTKGKITQTWGERKTDIWKA